MKGISLSIWIWIIGGLMIAALTFALAFPSVMQVGEQTVRNRAIDQFRSLNNDVDYICQRGVGTRKTRTIKLYDVKAIYASQNKREPDSKVPQYIADQKTSKGNYLCLSFPESHWGCQQHSCEVNATYTGKPLEGTEMYSLGEQSGNFRFRITMEKTDAGQVRLKADYRP